MSDSLIPEFHEHVEDDEAEPDDANIDHEAGDVRYLT